MPFFSFAAEGEGGAGEWKSQLETRQSLSPVIRAAYIGKEGEEGFPFDGNRIA